MIMLKITPNWPVVVRQLQALLEHDAPWSSRSSRLTMVVRPARGRRGAMVFQFNQIQSIGTVDVAMETRELAPSVLVKQAAQRWEVVVAVSSMAWSNLRRNWSNNQV